MERRYLSRGGRPPAHAGEVKMGLSAFVDHRQGIQTKEQRAADCFRSTLFPVDGNSCQRSEPVQSAAKDRSPVLPYPVHECPVSNIPGRWAAFRG